MHVIKKTSKKFPVRFAFLKKFVPLHPLSGLTRQYEKRSLRECERTRKRIGKAQYMSVRRWGRVGRGPESEQRKKELYSEEFDPGSG